MGRQSTLANKKTCSRERESESKAYVRTEEAMNHQQTYSANNSIKSLSIPWSQFLAWFMAAHLSLCIFHTPNLAQKPPCLFLCPLVSSENPSLPCSSFFQLNCRHMLLKKKKKNWVQCNHHFCFVINIIAKLAPQLKLNLYEPKLRILFKDKFIEVFTYILG